MAARGVLWRTDAFRCHRDRVHQPALFLRDGQHFVGTNLIQGGWHPDQANGGAVLALLGHCLEDIPSLVPMTVSRFTVDLMRPIPIGPRLRVESTVVREGKKIQIVVLHLLVDDVEHVRATALRLRDAELTSSGLPPSTTDERPADALPRPEAVERLSPMTSGLAGFLEGIDLRRAFGPDGTNLGTWVRLDVPVVADEPVRATSRLTVAFDYTNLVGIDHHPGTVTMINPDLNAHVLRTPTSEWISIVGETRFNPGMGRGLSFGAVSDDEGPFAMVSVSQLLQPR